MVTSLQLAPLIVGLLCRGGRMDRGELEAQYLGAGRGQTRGFTLKARVWGTLHAHDMLHMLHVS